MIFERTSYHPKPGRFEDVLGTRRKANSVREELGLKTGEIFVECPHNDDGNQVDGRIVHWECRFESEAEQASDLARRDDSPRFSEVRAEMQTLIANFNRAIVRQAEQRESVLRSLSLDGVPIVPAETAFRSSDLDLKGYLYTPPGAGPFPCLITNHGSSIHQGTSDVCRPGTAAVLMSWGIASFLPHRRGYGNSPGIPWRDDVHADYGTEVYDAQLAKRLSDESDDVIAALEHVEGLPEIDSRHIGVMGSSFGGTVTLLAAARCARFRCAVEFAGAAINWEKAPGLRETMLAAATKLTQPIYFLQAANDYSTRPTVELAASLKGTDKVVEHRVYPAFGLTNDEGHFLYGQGAAIWGPDVRRFLDRWL
ncbi:prolyl oligopeptidase family serine peptidase [Pelagibius litoralis]|uniref:Prolyl oligopeptidase family serine peptidase n=1 Tax=Pelagibius litoralis TaxID=374515 RepID=A0A967EX61_9PROT|nr:prolyl oligopeptidase family serine peptidase [Pelagibius litoralis]NIA67880.1 prolyl oligopeptidase family serine peptidase [Pelagibius litoralis]